MKNGYVRFAIILSLLVSTQAVGQVPKSLDSLEVYLQTHTATDTNYVNALLQLGKLTTRTKANYDRADSLLRAAEKVAIKLQFGLGIYQANTYLGANYYLWDKPQQTLDYLQKALTIAKANKLPPRLLANAMTNLGTAYRNMNQHEKALAISLSSLRMQEQYAILPRNENTYTGIGLALKDTRRPREAIEYFQQALVLNRQLKSPYGMAITEQNIGRCYDNLEQQAKALAYYRTALKHAKESESDLLQADILVNTGLALRKVNRLEEAKHAIEQALAITTKQQIKSAMATDYFNLGQVYEELKDYKPAEQFMKKALHLAHELNDKNKIGIYTQGLADLYGGMKNFQQAYAFQLERNQHIDSMTTVRTTAEVQRLVAHYKSQQKQDQINLLRQQAQIREEELTNKRLQTNALLIGGLLTLLLGAAVSAWLLNRARLRRLQEAQTLRKQIAHDLHDEVGSTLSSISLLSGMVKGLIAQNRPESVERAIQKINTDARQILEAMDEIIWTINPGNDSLHRIAIRLQEYAQPLMESKGIRFSLVAEPALEGLPISMEVRRNLYLIGKEAINNLVKYSQASQATLRFEHQKEQLKVVIEDNGRGFDPAQPSQRTGQSSMQQRAKAMGGTLAVQSTPGQGTRLQLVVSQ
ncbi:tetratricopeptide repeat-containing sensor histidine kinase [Spirosoma radiotolerans]|uniref:histidine kinase n=1 Tax=Spirosoma radiotolerans TaxID=1379870 RepID=A0A0E3ZSP2_9BACT|nr:tetratricopeptide repeat-containing sensor histidine kinase [Spirosoma radiotolerans]AKD54489.1 hypothetical protein SD10_05750 [Spirosoma radiotolerans]